MQILILSRSARTYQDYPLHQHGCWEILLSLRGEGTARLGSALYPFREGTVFCIPPQLPHCKSAPGGFVDGCILARDLPFSPRQGPLVVEDDPGRSLQSLYEMAFDVQLRDEPNAGAIVAALGEVICQMLLGLSEAGPRPNAAVEQFRRRLLQNVCNCDFDLAAAAAETGYHPSYLRRLFKDYYGRAPLDYLTHLRIDYAKRQLMLYHAVRSIREIAASAGFADPYYFSRIFRKYEGMSPSAYIQSLGQVPYELLARDLAPDDPEARRFHRKKLEIAP